MSEFGLDLFQRVDAGDGEQTSIFGIIQARLTAADALATKAEKLLELHRKHISTGYLVNEVLELDDAVREYREVSK